VSQGGLFPQWRPITKRVLDLFGRWGDSRTNLRSMMDSVIPVVVVDRFRDDDEGSVFGMSAFAAGSPAVAGQLPSVSFGSAVNDWELIQVVCTQIRFNLNLPGLNQAHLFTPIAPYNPALTPSPVGFFGPGLLPNRNFTFGTLQAIGGYNPAPPGIIGMSFVCPFVLGNFSRSAPVVDLRYSFATPIRIYRDVTLTIQWVGTVDPADFADLDVSILYRERPKVSVGGV